MNNHSLQISLLSITKKYVLWIIVFVFSLVILGISPSLAASDTIAVRIIPNPNHYSVTQWYNEQDFTGSPQSIIVNGYPAIRDGRTVYIDAANITEEGELYTNIYLISYNQDTDKNTTDIFGRILAHWKFNTNVDIDGTCSISTIACKVNNQCDDGYSCNTEQNKCILQEEINCSLDSQCPDNIFCNSDKAKIVRDVQ